MADTNNTINVAIQGIEAALAQFQKIKLAVDTVQILDESSAILLGRIRQRFLGQVDADGNAWLPSKASILRAASGRGGGTLFDTGNLFHSIQVYADSDTQRSIGTDVPYGAQHNYGLLGFPQREFLGFNPDDVTVVEKLIIKRIADSLS